MRPTPAKVCQGALRREASWRKRTIPMKMMALRGCPLESTLPIHEEPGRIPSRATAKTKRDAAVIARLVF